MVLLLSLHFLYLLMNSLVVGWSLNIADNAKSYREAMLVVHHGELELQGVVLAMGIVYENVLLRNAILTNLDHLQAEAFLNKAILVVLAKDKRLTVTHIDGIFLTAVLVVNRVVASIVEYDTVLQYLTNRSSLVLVGCLKNLYRLRSVGGN